MDYILIQEVQIKSDYSLPRGNYLGWEKFPIYIVYNFATWNEIEFHGFYDPSEKPYIAAVYVRVQEGTSEHLRQVC